MKLQFLAWQDITITRIPNRPGMFMADIRFRNLKTNTVDLEKASKLANHKEVINVVFCPLGNQENLAFSIPHCFLVLAIQRGILAAVTTIDELLNGDQFNITVSIDSLDLAILVN